MRLLYRLSCHGWYVPYDMTNMMPCHEVSIMAQVARAWLADEATRERSTAPARCMRRIMHSGRGGRLPPSLLAVVAVC
jgi:hypothetical protein